MSDSGELSKPVCTTEYAGFIHAQISSITTGLSAFVKFHLLFREFAFEKIQFFRYTSENEVHMSQMETKTKM